VCDRPKTLFADVPARGKQELYGVDIASSFGLDGPQLRLLVQTLGIQHLYVSGVTSLIALPRQVQRGAGGLQCTLLRAECLPVICQSLQHVRDLAESFRCSAWSTTLPLMLSAAASAGAFGSFCILRSLSAVASHCGENYRAGLRAGVRRGIARCI
jgi:hypothetical protein